MAVINRSQRQPGDFGFAYVWQMDTGDSLVLRPALRSGFGEGDVRLSWSVEPGANCVVAVSYQFAPPPAGFVPSQVHGEVTSPTADYEDAPFYAIRFQQTAGANPSLVAVTSRFPVEAT